MSMIVDVKKSFKGFSMSVAFDTEGKWQGVLGASGCGKSMTLKMIAGIVKPDEGRIVLGDRILFDSKRNINLSPQERNVGYLFQNYALFPNMTAEENILCGMKPQRHNNGIGENGQGDWLKELTGMLEIEDIKSLYPAQLSGGQQQRVALARCMAGRPDAILLDEPFSALDEYLKEKLQQDVKDVLETYPGEVVLVSHSRDEVYRFCRQITILDKGRVVAAGDTKEVFDNPVHITAARLSGCKNISKVEKIGTQKIWAVDWQVELSTREDVPKDIEYVGIRAHDILVEGAAENTVKVEVKEVQDTLFETNVIFSCQGKGLNGNGRLWWKTAKEDWRSCEMKNFPKTISLPAEKLILLKKG